MKKLAVLAVLVFVVLAGAWVGCRCAPILVSPTSVEEPASVVEPTPTEEIEEPTPTPVPPTPTPVLPTPTPEPTPVPPTPTPEPMRYVGLPPAEVRRLREQCLRENPDSLCLPLPVDPTQPGVEIFFPYVYSTYLGKDCGILGIRASARTIFYAPCSGVYHLAYMCTGGVCDRSSGIPVLECDSLDLDYRLAKSSELTAADFSDPALWDRLINDGGGVQLALGDSHFTLKTDDFAELDPRWGLNNDPGVQVFILFWGEDGLLPSFDEDGLLKDNQGRIVFIKP